MNYKHIFLTAVAVLMLGACTPATQTSAPVEPVNEEVESLTMPAEGENVDEMMVEESAADAAMSREITIDMFGFGYSEETITAKPGETITVNLTVSMGTHDFVIDELDVKSEVIAQGEETSVTFTIPEDAAGQTYEYYCSVGDHRARGMVGTLIVE